MDKGFETLSPVDMFGESVVIGFSLAGVITLNAVNAALDLHDILSGMRRIEEHLNSMDLGDPSNYPIAALYAMEHMMLCARAIMVIRNYLKKVGKEAAELTSKLIN